MAAATLDQAWLDELSEWLRIPSVSADPGHHDDVVRAAEWLRDFIRAAGGECELVEGTSPRPLVIGELRASANADSAPTVLVYGHFDVQPPEPLDLWDTPPFEPTSWGNGCARAASRTTRGSSTCCEGGRAARRRGGAAGQRALCVRRRGGGRRSRHRRLAPAGRAQRRRRDHLRRAHAEAGAAGVLHRHARALLLPRQGARGLRATCTRAPTAAAR